MEGGDLIDSVLGGGPLRGGCQEGLGCVGGGEGFFGPISCIGKDLQTVSLNCTYWGFQKRKVYCPRVRAGLS